MAHALTERSNGKVEMAYVGATPWHGLGQVLTQGAPLEQWVVDAGMDWRVNRAKVRFATSHGQDSSGYLEVPGQVVLHRSDNLEPLGIVSDKFKVVQPREVIEFFRDLTDDAGFTMETAGTMFGGKRFWALAHIGQSAVIRNAADMVGGYLLLCTGADGSLATTARLTTVRVVCNNTLSAALTGKAKHEVKLSHRSKFDAAVMKNELGIARDGFTEWAKVMRQLADESCSMHRAEQEVFTLMTDKDWNAATVEEIATARDTAGYKKIMSLFNGEGRGANMPGVAGTSWGLLNAVTEYVDHHIRARSQDNRLDSAWFGNGDKLKTKALELLTA